MKLLDCHKNIKIGDRVRIALVESNRDSFFGTTDKRLSIFQIDDVPAYVEIKYIDYPVVDIKVQYLNAFRINESYQLRTFVIGSNEGRPSLMACSFPYEKKIGYKYFANIDRPELFHKIIKARSK